MFKFSGEVRRDFLWDTSVNGIFILEECSRMGEDGTKMECLLVFS